MSFPCDQSPNCQEVRVAQRPQPPRPFNVVEGENHDVATAGEQGISWDLTINCSVRDTANPHVFYIRFFLRFKLFILVYFSVFQQL